MLTCLHSFCKKCLQKILEEQGSTLKCPTCGENSSVPSNDLNLLPKDLRKEYEAEVAEYEGLIGGDSSIPCDHCEKGHADVFCCDCCEFLCEKCADHHRSWRKTRSHELVSCVKKSSKESILKKIHKPLTCHIHSSESLDYYCNSCSSVLCFRCATVKHKDHPWEELNSVKGKERTGLLTYLQKVETAQGELKNSISQVEKVIQRVQGNHKQADQKIKEVFSKLQHQLKAREDALLAKSADIALGKESALTLQCEDLKRMENAISDVCTKLVSITQDYTAVEMLSAKQPISNRAQQLLDKLDKSNLAPCKQDILLTSLPSSQLETSIDGFGAVTHGGSLPANSTVVMIKPTAAVGRKRELVLTAKGVDGKPYPYGGDPVKAILSLMSSNTAPVNANVVDKNNGSYAISITPQSPGEQKLSITIRNEHIDGSPLAVYVRQPRDYSSLASSSLTFSLSSSAGDVAVGDNGHVYVAVTGCHCISVFDKNGSSLPNIGSNRSYGFGDGQFYSPMGIAVKGDIMYIADQSNHRVQKLTTSGKFITKLGTGTQGSGNGQLINPRGIALDKNGRVFVSEFGNARVSVFSADGTFSHHIRGDSSNNSTLSNPWGLAFDNDGNLHVADYSVNLIKVFTPEGMFITQYGKDIIQYPSGITIDDEGYTFIGEYDACRLSVLNAQHQRVRTVSSSFYYATGVCLDQDGFVYACDHSNNQVLKF